MMLSASDQPSSEQRRFALPRRTVALAITLLIHLLLLLMLITLAPQRTFVPMGGSRLISIAISSDQQDAARAKSQTKKKSAPAKAAPAAAAAKPPPPPPPVPNQSVPETPLIQLTHEEMVGLDATLRTHQSAEASAGADAAGITQGDSAKAGTGPHGEQLYAAEWYREPTDAELSFYMPKGVRGWGTIACRTVARFHVDDCIELDESPRGSRLSSGVREAAWQFLVRPPRVGGKLMVGEWVRIRIEMIDRGDKVER